MVWVACAGTTEDVEDQACIRGLSARVCLAIVGVGVLAVAGAAVAASRSGGDTNAGSAPARPRVPLSPSRRWPPPQGTDQAVGSAPAPAAPAVESSTTLPGAATIPSTAVPTTREPATSLVETTVSNAMTPGAFCTPEGSTGVSAKGSL